ncbi:SUMF1/EgtB/PvdO family nonheme iron enzyme [Profundibacter sp.]
MRKSVLSFILLGATALPALADITWKAKYYNPVPAQGDMTLPMPCGGAMTFRRIDTPNSDGAIGDVAVTLGQEGDDQPYLNGLRRSYVSGAFSDSTDQDDSAKGFFFLAKYELADAQYSAVMDPTCPAKAPRKRAFVPATDHSKLEYEIFAERYTLWLMGEAPDALPRAGDTQAYLRLPSEGEWEFSARGGMAVEEALFRAPRPPMNDGEEHSEFIAHGGSESAGGKVQVIGTLKSNPLGLHDMLGNASEIVGTPFSLVRHGRLHGQSGGFVKRGGDARTPLAGITSATRYEVPPFDVLATTATRDRYSGTRLAIAGLSITSAAQADDLVDALNAMAELDSKLNTAQSEEEVLSIIDQLSRDVSSPRAVQQLAVIRDTVLRGRAERNMQRDRSIRLILESGTLMCNQTVQRYLNALAIGVLLPAYDEIEAEAIATGDGALLQDVREAIDEAKVDIAAMSDLADREVMDYANLMEGLAEDYSIELLSKQSAIIAPDIKARSARRSSCLGRLRTHLAARQAAGFSDIELIKLDFQGIALTESDE